MICWPMMNLILCLDFFQLITIDHYFLIDFYNFSGPKSTSEPSSKQLAMYASITFIAWLALSFCAE